ncbi:MAG TPA: EF-Tu/IF-2/RF-3 family GTPase [Candidatus Bathyarchaeia archaeon]|nr:EF-Tu/IF-2/RF-3 family GTPase [Candidatus Bathyarchaeia archaeon]
MKSINFVILGDFQIASELGKRGTTTDLSIFDRKSEDVIYTWTVPITFPDKIQSLMQAVNIAEYAILNATKIDKYLGEQIIALDAVRFTSGFILHSYEVDEVKLKTLIKTTTISDFKFLDNIHQLKEEMSRLEPKSLEGDCIIPIHHDFNVKGIGTVILGVIKQGTVKTYDQLKILPSGNNILVKSIQMHDDPVNESRSPARVGLAIKGVDADDISRGDVLCSNSSSNLRVTRDAIPAVFIKSPYHKGGLTENQTYLLSVGIQIKPVKIKNTNTDTIEIIPEKPLVFFSGQNYALLKPDNLGTRIIAKGVIQ